MSTDIPNEYSQLTQHDLVVACMDARLHPTSAVGVGLGDAHIIRNAGGSAKDAIRSLTISQQLLGTEQIVIVKHTGRCLHYP